MYIKDTWNYKVREHLNFNNNDMEMMLIEIDKDSLKNRINTVIVTIYRRPGSDPKDFIQKVNETLNIIESEKKRCIHTGDNTLPLKASHHVTRVNTSITPLPNTAREAFPAPTNSVFSQGIFTESIVALLIKLYRQV
jgi:hypothetical protein